MATETVYGERGPKVGELFPNIVLPDQHGESVGLHQRRGRAVIVFIRSARWCKTQLVELQRVYPELERAGYALCAISYDRQTDLKAFAETHGIAYPILSDEGSRVIRELGILDDDLEAHHARFGVATRPDQHGVAYPMTFILDATGRVEQKMVEENYRSRYGGRWLLEELTGRPQVPDVLTMQGVVSARAWLDSPTYFAYQRVGLHLEVTAQRGWHLHGPEVPSGYTGLRIEVQSVPPGVRSGRPPRWPDTKTLRVAALEEEFCVYDATIEISEPLDFVLNRGSGPVRLDISLDFQVCSEMECLTPARLPLSLTVPEAAIP